jgi:hypothetical protein
MMKVIETNIDDGCHDQHPTDKRTIFQIFYCEHEFHTITQIQETVIWDYSIKQSKLSFNSVDSMYNSHLHLFDYIGDIKFL